MKQCSTCKEIKELKLFGKSVNRKDGLNCICKACCNKKAKTKNRSLSQRFIHSAIIAKDRGLSWTITKEEHASLLLKPCEYCGKELNPTGSGLDRMNNTIGYEIYNVVPCCRECNRVKSDVLTHEEMKAAMKVILKLRANLK